MVHPGAPSHTGRLNLNDMSNGESAGSSWMEPVTHPDKALVLRNVCLEPHRVHFFQNATAIATFSQLRESYRVWQTMAPARRAAPEWVFQAVHNDIAFRSPRNTSTLIGGTSFLWIPHKASPYNLFHFYNNLLLPLWQNVLLTGSEQHHNHLFMFKLWPLYRSEMLSQKWPHNMSLPAFFYVLQKLFAEVVWPVEDAWSRVGKICFRRLVWSQQLTTPRFPYQATSSNEWIYRNLSVASRARDSIRKALSVPLPKQMPFGMQRRPSMVWISRQSGCSPVAHADPHTFGRCIGNLAETIDFMNTSMLFCSAQVIANFKRQSTQMARDMQLRDQLQVLQNADIMVGVHGAGLAHTVYLEARSVVVELKDNYYFQNRSGSIIYAAMARVQGCGYTAIDLRGVAFTPRGYVLSKTNMDHLGYRAVAAWKETQQTEHDACCHYHPSPGGAHCRCQKGALHRLFKI